MNRKRDGDQSIVFPRLLTVFMGHRSLWATKQQQRHLLMPAAKGEGHRTWGAKAICIVGMAAQAWQGLRYLNA